MKAVTKITFYDEQDEKFFGEGPCRLLHAIEAEGSLRAAASSMGLAYSKALRIDKKCQSMHSDFHSQAGLSVANPVVEATLTQEGKEWIEKYERYRDACIQANRKLYLEIFSR